MSAAEWHSLLPTADNSREHGKEVLVLDCRNAYESDVGRFEGAQPLDTMRFRESWDAVDKALEGDPTRIPKPETRNPKPETRNSRPEIQNPKPETRNPKHEIRNTKLETRNPKHEIRDTKLETRNPNPQTENSKPQALYQARTRRKQS